LIAESHFSGVIRVDQAGEVLFERSAGWLIGHTRYP